MYLKKANKIHFLFILIYLVQFFIACPLLAANEDARRDSIVAVINKTSNTAEGLHEQIEALYIIFKEEMYVSKELTDHLYKVAEDLNMEHEEASIMAIRLKSDIYNNYFEEAVALEPIIIKKVKACKCADLPDIYNDLGYLYGEHGNKSTAISYYLDALEIYEQQEDPQGISYPIGNLAELFYQIGDYEKAKKYSLRAFESSKQFTSEGERDYNLVYDYFSLGKIYKKDSIEIAEQYFKKSYETSKRLKNIHTKLESINEYTIFLIETNRIEEADILIKEAHSLHQKVTNKETNESLYFRLNRAKILFAQNRIDEIEDIKGLLEISYSVDTKMDVLDFGVKYYQRIKDYNGIYEFFMLQNKILLDQKNSLNIGVFKTLENRRKAQKITSENLVLKEKRQANSWIAIIFILASLLLTLASILLYAANRKSKTLVQELSEINESLASKNKELEQLTYITTHDLKEPAMTIKGFAKLLHQRNADNLEGQGLKLLNIIVEASDNMVQMVSRLHSFLIVGNKGVLKQINMNNLIDSVLVNLEQKTLETKANIIYSSLPALVGYELELKQLFQNLISNALKFKRKDTIPTIKISCTEKSDCFLFGIKDNGIGISKEDQEKVFGLFHTLHNKSVYEGSGIGLANARKIVQLHKGEIWLESTQGEGSSFYFSIKKL